MKQEINGMRKQASVIVSVGAMLVLTLAVRPALAQSSVEVRQAELAVPFGGAPGKVVLVADQLVFVDDGQIDASFAIARSNISGFTVDAGVLTITTRTAVADRTGRHSVLRLRVPDATPLMRWYRMEGAGGAAPAAAAGTAATPLSGSADFPIFQARHDHLIGGCEGRVIITDSRLAYEATNEIGDSRQWVFTDIKEVTQDGPYKLKVTPFVGDAYNIELLGAGLDSAQFRMLLDRIAAARVNR